ncbi:MAG: indole-3-glycerol phosphate synthase TrpC [Ignavibacteriaceae bacterium]|nr:indole-3-glycerol phosphate synthase TrpC [Ignavibacteriaceae bacterium]
MKPDFLKDIIEAKQDEVLKLRRDFTWNNLADLGTRFSQQLSLIDSISSAAGVAIIAEIKKASPSKGLIREDFDHRRIADIYIEEAVAGISVLTERNYFLGSQKFLEELAKEKILPLLRKDFIIHELQIAESKSIGADCILLITELLSDSQIAEYTHAAKDLGMEVLLELHDEDQLEKINFKTNSFIGINNRNLKTFETSLAATRHIRKLIPDAVTVISESGISKKDDISFIADSGAKGVLIGEHFMRSSDIRSEVKRMKDYCSG